MSQIKVVVEQNARRRWAAIGFLLIVLADRLSRGSSAPDVIKWVKSTFRQRSIPASYYADPASIGVHG